MRHIVLCMFVLLFSVGSAAEETPRLTFVTKRIVNVGEVKQGEKVKHTVEIKNTGDAPLVILQISKSCNCTTAKASQNILKPGEKADIVVEVDTKGRIGTNIMNVTITANTPEKEHAIRISMNVVK